MSSTYYIKPYKGHSKATTSLIEKNAKLVIRKEVGSQNQEAVVGLEKQYRWLENLPAESRPYFPQVLDKYEGAHYFAYDMSFFELPTLDDLWFSGLMGTQEIIETMEKALELYFGKLYNLRSNPTPSDYVEKILIGRTLERISETERRSGTYKSFVKNPTFSLNSKKIKNARTLLAKITNDYAQQLSPGSLGLAHGDLTFANILTDGTNIVFIDPRGDAYNTFLYDLGKLYTSFVELWEALKTQNLRISIKGHKVSSTFPKKIRPHLETNDAEKEEMFWEVCARFPEVTKEKNWRGKITFCAGLQLIGNGPFTLHNRGAKYAILNYLTGAKLLEKAITDYL